MASEAETEAILAKRAETRKKLAFLLDPLKPENRPAAPPTASTSSSATSSPADAEVSQPSSSQSTECPNSPDKGSVKTVPVLEELLEYIKVLEAKIEACGEELPKAPSCLSDTGALVAQLEAQLRPEPECKRSKTMEVLNVDSSRCACCHKEPDLYRIMADIGKVYCRDCWIAWERCGWWRPSLRVLTSAPPVREVGGLPEYTPDDAFFLPAFCCGHEDLSLFEKLKSELPDGKDFSDWHGGRHLGVQFEGDGARHRDETTPPHLRKVVEYLEKAFGIEASASRINLYRDDKDYKPLHCDRGRDENGVPQVTVGASFGSTRELTMVHIKSGLTTTFPMRNGDVFSFTPELNTTFMHGVPKIGFGSPSIHDGRGERISLILWGSRVTKNSVEVENSQ